MNLGEWGQGVEGGQTCWELPRVLFKEERSPVEIIGVISKGDSGCAS